MANDSEARPPVWRGIIDSGFRVATVIAFLLGTGAGQGCLSQGRREVARVPLASETSAILELFDQRPGAWDFVSEERVDSKGEVEVFEVTLRARHSHRRNEHELLFEFSRVKGPGRRPAVLVTPILEGKLRVARVLSGLLLGAGFHTLVIHNPPTILAPDQQAQDVEQAFRESILDLRLAVDWLCTRPEVDPERLGSCGISLGAIRNSVLAAVEPRLQAHALLLGGADIPGILMRSIEEPVEDYRASRKEEYGVSEEELGRSLRKAFHYDNRDLMRSVDPRNVLLVLARYDRVVPYENGELLKDRLGGPETVVLPCGHYTSLPFLPFVSSRMIRFFRERF